MARFRPSAVELSWCGRVTQTTTEALSNLVTDGYFFTDKGVIWFRRYSAPGPDSEAVRPAADGGSYHYVRKGAR
jgi:hypothetical protein